MDKTPQQQAADFLEMIRLNCRISQSNGLPLVGSEADAVKEAINVLRNMAYVTPETTPKSD